VDVHLRRARSGRPPRNLCKQGFGGAVARRPKYTPKLITCPAYQQVKLHGGVFCKTAVWAHCVWAHLACDNFVFRLRGHAFGAPGRAGVLLATL
jgi:hypothetical protein